MQTMATIITQGDSICVFRMQIRYARLVLFGRICVPSINAPVLDITFSSPNAQGWVDEEAEGGNVNPFANLFGGGKKKENKEEGKEEKEAQQRAEGSEKPKKNGFGWPF